MKNVVVYTVMKYFFIKKTLKKYWRFGIMNRKKLCIYLGGMDGVGGTGRAVSILSNELMQYYDVSIVSYYQDKNQLNYTLNQGIKLTSIFMQPTRMVFGIFKQIPYLYQYIKKNKIDVLLVCGAIHMPGGIIAAKLAGVKVICCEHSNYTCVYDARFERQGRNFAAKHSDYLVTLTNKDIDNYRNNTVVKAQMTSIPNIIDARLFDFNSDYHGKNRKIISVGRLTYAKNYELLIKIAKIILENNPEWEWDIFGDGELRSELETLIREHDVDRLYLKGNVNDIYERYKDYDFFVMTSRYEGFPMVLLEAMANKLPCIAFDCQTGPSDIILNNVNGIIVEPENEILMIQAIQSLIDDEGLRRNYSSHTVESLNKFKTERIIEKWIKLIEE